MEQIIGTGLAAVLIVLACVAVSALISFLAWTVSERKHD